MPRLLAVRGYYAALVVCACFLLGMIRVFWKIEKQQVSFYHSPWAATPTLIPAIPTPSLCPDSEEVRMLKDLIKWPEHHGNLILNFSTSPLNCEYHILQPKAKYTVGETLEVFLTARDHQKRPKTFGGDFFRAKLHSPKLKAGVTGYVHDHQNGTYTIAFLLAWPGEVAISIRLIHSSEAIQIIRKARDSRPDKVYFKGVYQWNGTSETTECNLGIPNVPVCEYRDKRNGEQWVCVKPKHLPCDTLVYHITGGFRKVTDKTEDALLARNLADQTLPVQTPSVYVFPEESSTNASKLPTCTPSLKVTQPSGFYYNDVWTSLTCSHKRFPTPQEASVCLKGKIVYMFGDSTLRQWWEYLLDFIPSLTRINLHVGYKSGPLLAVDTSNGVMMQWRGHGKPLRTETTMMVDLHYMANDIMDISGGPDVVIVFTIWAHFTTYPVEVYINRLRDIRRAVAELLQRSPQTTVIIKSANTGSASIYGSDWLSLQLDVILRKMFSGLPVALVDAWEMTSCHYLKEDYHPGKVIIQNEVDMFLSFICPH